MEEATQDDGDPAAQRHMGQGGGLFGGKRRCRGRFDFEADDVDVKQVL